MRPQVTVHDPPPPPKLTSHTGPFVNNPREQEFLADSVNAIKSQLKAEARVWPSAGSSRVIVKVRGAGQGL